MSCYESTQLPSQRTANMKEVQRVSAYKAVVHQIWCTRQQVDLPSKTDVSSMVTQASTHEICCCPLPAPFPQQFQEILE
jgi:hypothetical protein